MKKFLTVLLALSVVFTYSFSSVGAVFAAEGSGSTGTLTHSDAIAQAEKEIKDDFAEKIAGAKIALDKTYTEKAIAANCTISGSVYAATLDELAKDFNAMVRVETAKVDKATPNVVDVAELKKEILKESVEANLVYAGKTSITVNLKELSEKDAAALVDYVTLDADEKATTLQAYYMVFTWVNALDDMKYDLNTILGKIKMSLYTNDVDPDDVYGLTWAQKAQAEKEKLAEAVTDTMISMEVGQSAARTALEKMYATVNNGVEAYEKVTSTIDGSEIVLSYKLSDAKIKTSEDLKNEGIVTDATKAELKARVLSNVNKAYKTALETYNKDKKNDPEGALEAYEATKEKIKAYEEVNNVLIEAGIITKAGELKQEDDPTTQSACLERVKSYKDAVALAATLKLQVEKDGSLKYVATKVDEVLAELQIKIYKDKGVTAKVSDFDSALNKTSTLAWDKELEVANIKAKLATALETEFYAPEKAKVEAKYQELIDKVYATTTDDQLTVVKAEVATFTHGVATKKNVDSKVTNYTNTTKFFDAVNQHIEILNLYIEGYEDGYREPLTSADRADVVEFLAENGARTNAEVAGLLDKAEEYAKSIKTLGEKKAEKAAALALIDAIPNYVTLADKDAVKAAYDAVKAAGLKVADYKTLTTAIGLIQGLEKVAIDDMVKALPATLTAADKAAVDAIYDAIDVYENEEMYVQVYGPVTYNKTAVNEAFEAVRAAALRDVENKIAALTANATLAEVQAVRVAVDEFVATYTDASKNYEAIARIENLDKLTFVEAQAKANTIAAVKAFEISTTTQLVKGQKMIVKWTVKGDESAIDGYRVYYSTKKSNAGFKVLADVKGKKLNHTSIKKTVKKGTRVYYRVKAYKMIDGLRYLSAYSSAGHRTWK